MKVLAATTMVLLAATSLAGAADLPSRYARPSYAPPPPVPVFTWSGFYIGGNAGYAFDGRQSSIITGDTAVRTVAIERGLRPGFGTIREDGFTGGGQIGYNYQLGNVPLFGNALGGLGLGTGGVVLGVEADAAYTDLRGSAAYITDRFSGFSTSTDFVGTVRGRLGYGFDRILVYGTGGFAYGGVNDTATYYGVTGTPTFYGHAGSIRTGYAYGGGVEFAVPTQSLLNFFQSSAVTVKVEYLHYDLGSYDVPIVNIASTTGGFTQHIRSSGNIVRGGINYKFDLFGSSAAPVVARY